MTSHTYVFSVPAGYVKIGPTSNLDARVYQLRWGERPPYVTWATEAGEIIYLLERSTDMEARLTERAWQHLLSQWRVENSSRGGGPPEWFRVSGALALAELARVDWNDPAEAERFSAPAPPQGP